jgi:hypothetical protein
MWDSTNPTFTFNPLQGLGYNGTLVDTLRDDVEILGGMNVHDLDNEFLLEEL